MRPLPFDTHPPQRILIIKPSSLGDVTHALPVLRFVRRKWPAAHISWLVAPFCAGLLQGNPDLNDVILFDRKRYGSAWKSWRAGLELWRFHRDLRRRRFDLVIDLQGLFRSGWLARATGAPVRIGFENAREGAPWFYTHAVPVPSLDVHAVDRYLSVAAALIQGGSNGAAATTPSPALPRSTGRGGTSGPLPRDFGRHALGCEPGPAEFSFPHADEDRRYIDALIPPGERYAVLMPGANWETKRWPVENFAALVEPLKERFGLRSVLSGGADVVELAQRVPQALNLAGKTNLRQLVALLEQADLVVANDSGPMHIAAALGRPLVTVFGPTNPVRTGPYGRMECVVRIEIECSPCYSRKCSHSSHMACLRKVDLEAILACAQRQLAWDAAPR